MLLGVWTEAVHNRREDSFEHPAIGIHLRLQVLGNNSEWTAPPGRHPALRDHDDLPASLRTDAIEPGDLGDQSVRNTYLRGEEAPEVLRSRGVPNSQRKVRPRRVESSWLTK